MIHSVEAAVLHLVIEGKTESAAERLHDRFLDSELIELKAHLATMRYMIDQELSARQHRNPSAEGTES
jgi:hypothetical protein